MPQNKPRRRSNQTPAERTLQAQLAVHTSWANTSDRAARTAKARNAFLNQFERQVDPNGELAPEVRAQRAEHARKAHFKRLALQSAKARRLRQQKRNGGAAQ